MKPAGNVFDDISGMELGHESSEIREGDYWFIGDVKWVVVGKKENHLLMARADKPELSVILEVSDL